MDPLTFVFWLCVLVIFYGYAGFPLLVAVVGRLLDREVRRGSVTPSVSLIIAAHDEADGIAGRVGNALASDYPETALEVIVASDGSTDGTAAIASGAAGKQGDRLRVLDLPRVGKAAALAEAVGSSRGEILVFSDANTLFEPHAIRELVRNFADPEVGGVAGNTGYVLGEGGESSGRGESLYWDYDSWLKQLESRTGSVVSAHGGMYAIRRRLFQAPNPSMTDDFAISSGVVSQGMRLVFEPAARGFERPLQESSVEFARRVRLMTRGLHGVLLRRPLLNPFRYGFYSVSLFSHKVLRRLLPLLLPVLLVASVALAPTGGIYALAAVAQLVFYAAAAAGWALRGTEAGRNPVLYVPFYYCLANAASVAALWNVVRGKRIERWTPHRHQDAAMASGGR